MLGDDIVENKISYINKISNLTRKYNKKYNEYLRKINELNKIIDEKEHKNEKRKWKKEQKMPCFGEFKIGTEFATI